ncbi:MAG: aspartate dehydrogenase [Candidatus Omnitrophica bacterium]|nr:aspartate dehydrogenase [Candidatus Omnitrophota bacterium]MDD5352678.1 aspartate dehydrogenase [Candidatus Omnitrophota bacterium]MDD5550277.1 aspartate dehydrogenase [Candidatus Omnitrophota bacterium]
MKKIRIGIVGCGAIGKSLAKFIDRELNSKAEISAICDLDLSKTVSFKKILKKSKPVVTNLDKLIKNSDLIIESSSAKVSYEVAKKSVSNGKSILIMSIGGIILKAEELFALARKNRSFIYLPSGAICGIDGMKALSLAGIEKVTLTTRKPPKALSGVAYLMQKGIDVNKIKKETVIFEGTALSAIKYFPQNINVAALLSISGIGAKKTKVKIITSPEYKYNYHEIEIVSKAGVLKTISQNVAFKENPKTSYLAALSAMAVLKGIFDSAKIGN